MPREHIHFVTGKLAEPALRKVLAILSERAGFDHSISVLKISVAALMTPDWISRRLHVPPEATRVVVPGLCAGDLATIVTSAGKPVIRGPKDLRDLPEFFGDRREDELDGTFDIAILAEINHAPRLAREQILDLAARYHGDGADLIDLGCDPGGGWTGVADTVRALCDAGHRVSIDTMDPTEAASAVAAGAELVLSVNSGNREVAAEWGCEVVVVPDEPKSLQGLDETIEFLVQRGVKFRIDPILEPIGFGFAHSLGRYLAARRRYPDAEIMMGIGNLTELTDADSAGLNVLLLGFCQELGIRSVLTTEVINWARTSVKECDLARRLVHHAVTHQTLPKRLEPRLVMLRDTKVREFGPEGLEQLRAGIRDNNYRIFAEGGALHLIGSGFHLRGRDPFELFAALSATGATNLDASHSFYLGYEMAKALTALQLDKQYRQDQALDWGFLTVPEATHRAPASGQNKTPAEDEAS
ncbi:MAG: dihydropteroate synthase [Planctomycetes bacterium]|nr:dihydropteroate synthase [Planctomycetota bacterium]